MPPSVDFDNQNKDWLTYDKFRGGMRILTILMGLALSEHTPMPLGSENTQYQLTLSLGDRILFSGEILN